MVRNKAVFLDRDGVINHDPGDYTRSLDEFYVLPTVFEALKTLQDAGYMLILITNQGGIAKDSIRTRPLTKFIGIFIQSCADEGITITNVYYSPHHPDFGRV